MCNDCKGSRTYRAWVFLMTCSPIRGVCLDVAHVTILLLVLVVSQDFTVEKDPHQVASPLFVREMLKELQNYNLRITHVWSLFFYNTGLSKSAFSTYVFFKLVSRLSVFYLLFV